MSVSVTCPPIERLQDLAVGRVSDADLISLGSHVLECNRCGETISRLNVTDTIADAFQAIPRVRVELPHGVLDAAIQQACQLAEQTSAEANNDTQPSSSNQPSSGITDLSQNSELPFDPSEILLPPRSPDELGRLGPYRVLRLLGAGGMGLVFLAEDERLKRPVAIKAMRPALADSRDSRQRFLREARAAAALQHDHIVTVHQVGAHGGTLWLAMELLEGESLHARLHRDQRLTPIEAVRIARQIAEALAAAHSLGLVHRDIKPANVWLENRTSGAGERLPPRVKVLDFGLARTAADDAQITRSGVIVGTPAYMAPEQARGDHVDARCDLFSLGCVLYRMLVGHAPFRGNGTMAVLMALATHIPPPVRDLAPGVPDELNELILRLLAKDPAERPHSSAEVAQALAAIEEQIVSPPPPVLLAEGRRETLPNQLHSRQPLTRVHWLIASAIASLVSCLALAGILLQIATPVGTIILEIEQPELVGAVVTIDDQQSFTIKTKDSPEPIKVVADAKQHSLKVEKGGFETLTRQFTVKAGKTQALSVRLLPQPKATPAVDRPASHAAALVPGLDFSQRANNLPPWVDLFPVVPSEPLTIEMYVTATATAGPDDLIGVWSAQANLFLNARGSVWRWSTYNYKKQQIEEISAERLIPGKRTHLAGTWTGKELQFFVDGRFQGRLEPTRKISEKYVPTLFGAKWSDYTPFPGTIDEARLSNIARYDSDFSPPATFASDRDTLALYHFDEGKGVVLTDSSGNNRHGQIVNARWVPEIALQAGSDTTTPVAREPETTNTPSVAVVASMSGLTNPSPRPSEITFTGHEGKVSAVLLAPHRKQLLTGGNTMHKIAQGKTLVNYPGSDNSVRFWDLQTGTQASQITKGLGRWQIQGLALSPDGTQIAASSCRPGADFCDATITVWKLVGQTRLHHFSLPGRPGVKAPWFDLDGRTLFAFRHDTTLHKLDLTTGKETSAAKLDPKAAEGMMTSVCMSADRKLAFGGMRSGLIQVWSVSDGKNLKELRGHTAMVQSLSATTDGKYLASASNDRTARIWDLESDQCLRQCPHQAQVSAVEFAGSKHRIVTGDVAGGVNVWDADNGSLLKRLEGHKDAILCLAVSPDGHLLVTGSADKTARTWALRLGRADSTGKNEPLGDPGFIPVNSEGKPLNLNFESGTLKDWKAEGKAFSGQPVNGDAGVKKRGKTSNHTGTYWIGGYELLEDPPQGTLTSESFVVSHPFASYLIGGGSSPKTRVEIVTADDERVFHSASGKNAEAMTPVVVDLKNIMGRSIRVRIVDDCGPATFWGHVNFDDFRFHQSEPKF